MWPSKSVILHSYLCGSATVNSAFALVDLVIKESLIPFSRLFFRLGGTLTHGRRSVFTPGFEVADRVSCVPPCWVVSGCSPVMRQCATRCSVGQPGIKLSLPCCGTPAALCPSDSEICAATQHSEHTHLDLRISIVSLYKCDIADPQTRFVSFLRTNHGATEGPHRLQRRQTNLRRDTPSRRRSRLRSHSDLVHPRLPLLFFLIHTRPILPFRTNARYIRLGGSRGVEAGVNGFLVTRFRHIYHRPRPLPLRLSSGNPSGRRRPLARGYLLGRFVQPIG